MKCLLKYQWVKLPRNQLPSGKGIMGMWARLASRAAFRAGTVQYCRYRNQVTPGVWAGGIVGLKSILGVKRRQQALAMMDLLKIIIPVLEAIEEPEDYRDQPRGDVLHYLLNKRLGAEVDYIVKGIDQENGVVAASRLEAMALKRREYYFRTDRDGNYQIYEGIRAEARVISVIRAGIFVDLFGAECYIPLRELSYQRWVDAAQHYCSGWSGWRLGPPGWQPKDSRPSGC